MYKRMGLFVVLYFVITMSWAYPWHMVFFHDQYIEWGAFQRAEPIMQLGIAAIIVQGLVISYLYERMAVQSGNVYRNAIQFNLIIGLMTYTAMGFATAAKFQIEPVADFLIYHTIFQFIQFTLTGLALGWVYRNTSS
ncbi:MAG: hypothetical protein ACRBB6_08595 [Neptuniibacter sp.]